MKLNLPLLTLSVCFSQLIFTAGAQSFQWAQQVTGNSGESIQDMITDNSGNIYVIGSFTGTIVLGSQSFSSQGSDIWLAKFGSNGNFIWGKAIPDTGSIPDDDNGLSITLDGSNNVYVSGSYRGQKNFNPGGSGGTTADINAIFFAKYSSSGAFQWVKSIESNSASGRTIAFSSAQNRIYLAGEFSGSSVDFDPNGGSQNLNDANGQSFIASYGLNGTIISAKNFGSFSSLNDMAIDPAGNIYITGRLTGTAINMNPDGSGTSFDQANGRTYFAKYTSGLGFVSARQITGSTSGDDQGFGLSAPGNDQIFAVGRVNNGLYLARFNSNFQFSFEKKYGGNGWIDAVYAENGEVYFSAQVAGSAVNLGNGVSLTPVNFSGDIFMARTDFSGNASWGITIPVSSIPGNSGFGIGTAIVNTPNDEFIVAGYFGGATSFDHCLDAAGFTSNDTDAFFTRYSDDPWHSGIGPVSGPPFLCGTAQQYTVSNVPAGAVVTWSHSNNIVLLSSQGSNPASFKAVLNGGGPNSFISATITSDCGTVTRTKAYISTSTSGHVANPAIEGDAYVCGGGHYTAEVPAGATGIIWDFDNNNLTLLSGGLTSHHITVQFKPGSYSGWVSVRSYTSCNGPNPYPNTLGISNSCASGYYVVFPNPLSTELTIEEVHEDSKSITTKIRQNSSMGVSSVSAAAVVYIYNSSNEPVYEGRIADCKSVDVRNWPRGIYFLKITSGERLLYQQKVIKE